VAHQEGRPQAEQVVQEGQLKQVVMEVI
jgi:hypothetical protein